MTATTRNMRLRAAACLATVVAVAGLAGCAPGSAGREIQPDFTGDLTVPLGAPASGAAAASVAKPATPTAEHSSHGAADVVRYFWSAYNYAYDSYDTSALDAVSRPDCSVCSEVRNDVQLIAAVGTRVRGHRMELVDIRAITGADSASVTVESTISRADGVAVEADGSQTELPGMDPMHSTATLTWDDGAWKIGRITTSTR